MKLQPSLTITNQGRGFLFHMIFETGQDPGELLYSICWGGPSSQSHVANTNHENGAEIKNNNKVQRGKRLPNKCCFDLANLREE